MVKAFIILAHKNPFQVERLIKRLDDGVSSFFIHYDKKSLAIENLRFSELEGRIDWLEGLQTDWGGFNIVQATVNGLKAILSKKKEFEKIILLSGQDYPIKNNEFIDLYFSTSSYKVFLDYTIIPNYKRWKPRGGMYRIDSYYLGLKKHEKLRAKTLNLLTKLIPAFGRKQPGMIPYAGSQWWTLDMASLKYILQFLEDNPLYTRYHKYTFAPDELFFHTILLNTSDFKLRNSIKNDNLRFMKWEDSTTSHPDVLTVTDIHSIFKSQALFARKFDLSVDNRVCDLIDAHLCGKNAINVLGGS